MIFDGVCTLCNATVDFVIKRDKAGIFKYTANQNLAGATILEAFGQPVEKVDTVYLFEKGKLYSRSTAALKIAEKMPFPWNLFKVLLIFPAGLRDVFYKIIAANRYRFWGKKETCRLPSPEERARFLD